MIATEQRRTVWPFGDLGRSFRISQEAALKSPATVRLYLYGLRGFERFLAETGMPTDPQHISREHVESYLAGLRTGHTPGTVRAYYWGVRQFFAFLLEEHEIKASPCQNIREPHVVSDPPAVMTDEAVRKLLKVCGGPDFRSRRDEAIIRVLIDCGFRRAEMGGMELESVDWERRVFRVRGKGDKVRRVPFSRKTALALDRYLRLRKGRPEAHLPYLWLGARGRFTGQGIYQMVRARATEAGIGKAWTHLFRHSFASAWLAAGGQEGDLMRLGGWENRAMLDRYGASAAQDRAIEAGQKLSLGDRF